MTRRAVLVWNQPGMSSVLSRQVLGGVKVDDIPQPRLEFLIQWLLRNYGSHFEAYCFVNIPHDANGDDGLVRWVHFLRTRGFNVFVKRRRPEGGRNIDYHFRDFLKRLEGRQETDLYIATDFHRQTLEVVDLLGEVGFDLSILTYREEFSKWQRYADCRDIEAIDNVFAAPIPRPPKDPILLTPPDGEMFPPLAPAVVLPSTVFPRRPSPGEGSSSVTSAA